MPFMPTTERRQLEKGISEARRVAERAAENALTVLGVAEDAPPSHLDSDQRRLRNRLRARARQLGAAEPRQPFADVWLKALPSLREEIAYEQWHRMLFARFLAENGLLRHPIEGVPVTLDNCRELASEEGAEDEWDLAARYASTMLPGLFPSGDPSAQVRLAPEHRQELERLVMSLPPRTFTSDDGLGWVYQYWQSERKKQVNEERKAGLKIGPRELPSVTQLFTEEYMVRFLLENTLGAWWAGKYPESPLLADMEFLRRDADGRPIVGTYPSWPQRVAELKVLDPACGSSHFLVVAFDMLRRMRMEEESLSEADATDAVLRDNLFGLELDRRCTQIAMFALSLAAWRVGGHPETNIPRIACSGTPVKGQLDEWRRLAAGDDALLYFVEQLYKEFTQAPVLGSLLDPKSLLYETGLAHRQQAILPGVATRPIASQGSLGLFRRSPQELGNMLAQLAERFGPDDDLSIVAAGAAEVARAAKLLGGHYHLVVTNVPYLSRAAHDEPLRELADKRYPEAKNDLATIFLERCLQFAEGGGTVAAVTPQNWLFLGAYKKLREQLLVRDTFNLIAVLGEKGFESAAAAGAFTALVVLMAAAPSLDHQFVGLDASAGKTPAEKSRLLRELPIVTVSQHAQLEHYKDTISFRATHGGEQLEDFATVYYGSKPGQTTRVTRYFWELPYLERGRWRYLESSPDDGEAISGKSEVCLEPSVALTEGVIELGVRGREAWGKTGVIFSRMRDFPSTRYLGEMFDDNTYVAIPKDNKDLAALIIMFSSGYVANRVREVNQKMGVDVGTFVSTALDFDRWQKVAQEKYPNGLPEPHSDDPTQWLFKGQPIGSEAPLQVAVARLLGYRWPEQPSEPDPLDALADPDGIVCLPALAGEQPAAERLRALLATAYGDEWSPSLQARLLAEAGSAGKGLATWLRDDFFQQHVKLFHNRPFIWHIWDGRKDGFSALVNYHKLDGPRLEKLAHTYLGDWIRRQRDDGAHNVAGAEARLVAATKLQEKLVAIRHGEAPYDIYVRWKPLHQQPLGWEPDLNDGVRLNIRPFVLAEVLRAKFTINWNKDRGANPVGSDVYRWSEEAQLKATNRPAQPDGAQRLNDLHLPRQVKEEARARAASEAVKSDEVASEAAR